MSRVISPDDMNRLVEPIYLLTPVLMYHMTITIFLALSILLAIMQQAVGWLIDFAFLDIDANNGYLHTLGDIWYIIWAIGLVASIGLYYVSVNNI